MGIPAAADHHPPAINLVVLNVPGPVTRLRRGAELRELYSVGPVLRIGLNITVWSHRATLRGAARGRDEVPEPWLITDAMQDASTSRTAAARLPVVASGP
jgi:hypothetical protein